MYALAAETRYVLNNIMVYIHNALLLLIPSRYLGTSPPPHNKTHKQTHTALRVSPGTLTRKKY